MTISDLAQVVIAAGMVVLGATRTVRMIWRRLAPVIGPLLVMARDRAVRDILRRLGKLEERVDIIEAVQEHEH